MSPKREEIRASSQNFKRLINLKILCLIIIFFFLFLRVGEPLH